MRFYAKTNNFDGDIEVMSQTGSIGNDTIMAWAVGSVAGYTLSGIDWKSRLGVQFDAASGNSDPRGNVLQTFNPLFPNGLYFTLAGYTTYVNLIHFKQSMTLQPTSSVKIFLAVAEQWRQTTADAVYTIPNIPAPGTAGQPGLYTGTYGQVEADWMLTQQLSFLVQAVYFDVSDVIVRADGAWRRSSRCNGRRSRSIRMVEQPMRQQRITGTSGNTAADLPSSRAATWLSWATTPSPRCRILPSRTAISWRFMLPTGRRTC